MTARCSSRRRAAVCDNVRVINTAGGWLSIKVGQVWFWGWDAYMEYGSIATMHKGLRLPCIISQHQASHHVRWRRNGLLSFRKHVGLGAFPIGGFGAYTQCSHGRTDESVCGPAAACLLTRGCCCPRCGYGLRGGLNNCGVICALSGRTSSLNSLALGIRHPLDQNR